LCSDPWSFFHDQNKPTKSPLSGSISFISSEGNNVPYSFTVQTKVILVFKDVPHYQENAITFLATADKAFEKVAGIEVCRPNDVDL